MGRESRGGYGDYDARDGYDRATPPRGSRSGSSRPGTPRSGLNPPSLPSSRSNPNRSNPNRSNPNRSNGRGGSGPRSAREEEARRRSSRRDEAGYDEERPARGERSRRSISRMARDFSQAMSRQLGSVMRGTERAMHRGAPRSAYAPAIAAYPGDVPEEILSTRYRRSRTRLRARKWRIARTPINPIKYFVILGSIAMAVVVVLGAGGAGLIYSVNYYNQHLVQIQALAANLQGGHPTIIYDRNGQILYTAKDVNSEYSYYAPLAQISKLQQNATIDVEDPTFYTNIGVDPKSILRAGAVDASSGGAAQGASTITQQLVKNMVLADSAKSYQRKVNEAILAMGVTLNYTKGQILEMYLNSIDYGNNNQGIEAAARNYYGLTPGYVNGTYELANQKLDLAQAAILAGVPNAPTKYLPTQFSCKNTCPDTQWDNPCTNNPMDDGCNPSNNYDYITDGHEWLVYRRARLVLDDMVKQQDITSTQRDAAVQEVHDILQKHKVYVSAGISNGNVTDVSKNAPHFVDWLLKTVLPNDFGINTDPAVLAHAGLKIYTTLDLNLDDYAQARLKYYIQGDPKTGTFTNYWYCGGNIPPINGCQVPALGPDKNVHNGAVVAEDPFTGDILAMVGSVDYGSSDKQVLGYNNIATSPYRSMGSSTKPLVYATAFQMGWNPATMLQDQPVCFPAATGDDPTTHKPQVTNAYAPACAGWYSPTNYENFSFSGNAPIRPLLANSLNIPATEAMSFVGDGASDPTSDTFLAMTQRLGITTLQKNQMGPATALGAQDIPLVQLTGAYATFADAGVRHPYRAILRIEDQDGDVLYQAPSKPLGAQVLSPQVAYEMTSILTDNKARLPDFGWYNPLYFDYKTVVNNQQVPEYPGVQIAAKTGTSQGPLDIVTMGYSPYMALGVWFGNTDGNDELAHDIIGIAGAGYVFHDIMVWCIQHYHWPTGQNGTQPFQFPIPPGLARGQFNCTTGLAPYKGTNPAKNNCQFKAAAPAPPGLHTTPIYQGLCPYPAGYGDCEQYPDIDWYIAGQAPLQS